MTRTVILACSATKRKDTAELSALARYDGPAWRTLRANLSCAIEPPLALSAEHGLISAYQEIPDYDRRLTEARACELVPQVAEQLVQFIRLRRLRGETFAFGGRAYRELLEAAIELAEGELGITIPVTFSSGGIGEQLGQLRAFLTATPTPAPAIVDELEEALG